MIPSDTSILSSAAVEASTTPETATKSPNEHNGSAWRERRYAIAVGESSLPAASYTESISGSMGAYTAAPAGETCLKDAAAGRPVAAESSLTSCQAFKASRRLM